MSFALGVTAALAAPFLMVVGFIAWDNHWSGSAFALNMFKCILASTGFLVLSVYTRPIGEAFSSEVFTLETVGFLMLSSTIGLIVGDWTWLEGMRVLGARKVIVMDSLKPFLAVLVGRIFLGEELKSGAVVGLIFTVVGVLLVGLEHKKELVNDGDLPGGTTNAQEPVANETYPLLDENFILSQDRSKKLRNVSSYADERRQRTQKIGETYYGLCMGVLNVILHTFGALITKIYGVGMNTWEINLVRFGFAGIVMLLISLVMHLRQFVWMKPNDVGHTNDTDWYSLPTLNTSRWIRVCFGVALVSFLCPALTNYAMFQVALALLLTLESVGPLYSLPLAYLLENEKPTFRASLGAILAVTGIIILAVRGETAK